MTRLGIVFLVAWVSDMSPLSLPSNINTNLEKCPFFSPPHSSQYVFLQKSKENKLLLFSLICFLKKQIVPPLNHRAAQRSTLQCQLLPSPGLNLHCVLCSSR